jgi:hypothetical protein
MIEWYWLIPALFAGAFFGVVITSLCVMTGRDGHEN